VIDDHIEMAETVADALSERGYDAMATASAREALRMLRAERFDAVVTDLLMPDIDGLTLLRASRGMDPSRPVMIMTAFASLETALAASDDGAYHYLTKPFRVDTLVWLIERAIAGA
jgi:two-component system response regulator HydG